MVANVRLGISQLVHVFPGSRSLSELMGSCESRIAPAATFAHHLSYARVQSVVPEAPFVILAFNYM